jgi:predicted membrane protein
MLFIGEEIFMKIKDIIGDKKKIIPLSIGVLCLLGVGAYGATSTYKDYQEKQIEQSQEQHKNEQIEQAKEVNITSL